MADSAGKGILIVAVCHGLAQLEARWDKSGAQAIWDTAGIKVILGGVTDADTLDALSRLCGEVALRTRARTRYEQGGRGHTVSYKDVRVLPPELLRTLPEWRALVLRTNLSPVIVRLRMAWRRRDYQRAKQMGTPPQPRMPARAAGQPELTWPQTGTEQDPATWPTDPASPHPEAELPPLAPDELPARHVGRRPRPAPHRREDKDASPLPPSLGRNGIPRRPWEPPVEPGDDR
jgi:type IV secretory pathway TraG/TraD family ATPase VirD4